MSGKVVEYFQKIKAQNKIGHAYLICNCTLDTIEDELNSMFSQCFFEDKNIDLKKNEDIILIEPENNVIKKADIFKIQDKVKKTSQISNCKIYIINQCEKMNDFAANSLLKLLEEPEDRIYAFLLTGNVDAVLKTIYSRCQILKLYNDDELLIKNKEENSEVYEVLIKFMRILNSKKEKSIAYYSFLLKKIKDRESFKDFLTLLLLFYREIIDVKLGKPLQYFNKYVNEINEISDIYTIEEIVNYLDIISKYLNYVDMNLNTNLLLDRLIIELEGEEV